MNILVNGCSFSRGPGSWPYHLPYEIVNLAQAGAGNDYIWQSTVSELCHRQYDLVIVMWTQIERVDFKVSNIHDFQSTAYTSHYQYAMNDWPCKMIEPINDQNYVEKDWVFGCGAINGDRGVVDSKLFTGLYKHLEERQFVYHFMMKVLALQNFLHQNNQPYIFSVYKPYMARLQTLPHLYQQLDLASWCISDNINSIAERTHGWENDRIHPNSQSHQAWADVLHSFVRSKYPKLVR